jgi:hypothetical protein
MNHFEKMKREHAAQTSQYVRDRYNRVIQEGTEIDVAGQAAGGWMVRAIVPVLDPKVPPGTVRLVLEQHVEIQMQGGSKVPARGAGAADGPADPGAG